MPTPETEATREAFDAIEPYALKLALATPDHDAERVLQLSHAISLRRIADALSPPVIPPFSAETLEELRAAMGRGGGGTLILTEPTAEERTAKALEGIAEALAKITGDPYALNGLAENAGQAFELGRRGR